MASDIVREILKQHGPLRSSTVVAFLQEKGISAEAARQQVSRARPPIRKFPVPLLPKREAFLYLQADRTSEKFGEHFLRDLRASGSVFGAAVDGLTARGGLVTPEEFAVISSAPIAPQKGQISSDIVAKRLIAASFAKQEPDDGFGACLGLTPLFGGGTTNHLRARRIAEGVILDGLREWARRMGLASFNRIAIRGEADWRPVGQFAFDMSGPSYLQHLQIRPPAPGFLAADVFAEGMLDEHQVQYFIRKGRILKSSMTHAGVLAVLVAPAFTGAALKAGHAAGLVLATPRDLFGTRVAAALNSLMETLSNAAAYASSSPERLVELVDRLQDIAGRAGNLRGVLFELLAAYLARRDAVSIDMGINARDPSTGKCYDIDVQKITAQASAVTAIECKGKEPGGMVSLAEVEEWIKKLPTFQAYYRSHNSLREAKLTCEIWTSGEFHPDALVLLMKEKAARTKNPIDWKSGTDVANIARAGKEKAILDTIQQHFLRHPLSTIVFETVSPPVSPSLSTTLSSFTSPGPTSLVTVPDKKGRLS